LNTQKELEEYLRLVFPKMPSQKKRLFQIFMAHEVGWERYFYGIFLRHYDPKKDVRLVFWESGPEINKPSSSGLTNSTYAFTDYNDIINGNSYIALLGKEVLIDHITLPLMWQLPKEWVLEVLSERNYLIVDLYATHGFSLINSRDNCDKLYFPKSYTLLKLKKLKNILPDTLGSNFSKTIYHLPYLDGKTWNEDTEVWEDKDNAVKVLTNNLGPIKQALGLGPKDRIKLKPY